MERTKMLALVIVILLIGGVVSAYLVYRLTLQTMPASRSPILVDSCGANPNDDLLDSTAAQDCIDQAEPGDTVLFTSPGEFGYKGYMIDKTLFLVSSSPPVGRNLTFSSTDPERPALLRATSELKGWIIRLHANPQSFDSGKIDDIVLRNLRVDGGRDARVAFGRDGIPNGIDDNYGSWLPAECVETGTPWCHAGGIFLNGAEDWGDPSQNYEANPDSWSVGIVVEGMIIQNVEVATALSFSGAAGAIRNSVVDTSGEHVHESGCAQDDPDEDLDWADGITFSGPDHLVSGNIIFDASDVGIVFFGGKNTIISNNVVVARSGNHGMFGGIMIDGAIFGDVTGVQVIANRVVNEGNVNCGGIHAGIIIGSHMWGGGCVDAANPSTVGNSGSCSAEPVQPNGALCIGGQPCQQWAYVRAGGTFVLRDNLARGAQVNFLVEGLDLSGVLVASNNTSEAPRDTDWQASTGCTVAGRTDFWVTYDFVAHSPTLPGWTEARIHCER